jgi:hypothetical protein
MAKFARCSFAKTTANSSMSRPQRPLIHDSISFPSLPPPFPRRQHFREKFFRCPFHSKSAPRNRCPPPPPTFDASYAPAQKWDLCLYLLCACTLMITVVRYNLLKRIYSLSLLTLAYFPVRLCSLLQTLVHFKSNWCII